MIWNEQFEMSTVTVTLEISDEYVNDLEWVFGLDPKEEIKNIVRDEMVLSMLKAGQYIRLHKTDVDHLLYTLRTGDVKDKDMWIECLTLLTEPLRASDARVEAPSGPPNFTRPSPSG